MALLYLLVARSKAEDAEGDARPTSRCASGGRRGMSERLRSRTARSSTRRRHDDAGRRAGRGRPHRRGRTRAGLRRRRRAGRRRARLLGRARPRRPARAPARAGPGVQGDDRDGRRARRSPAASPTVACMANTNPVNDNAGGDALHPRAGRAREARRASIRSAPSSRRASTGEQLAEIGEMRRAGIVAVSDDGRPIMDAGLMRRALEYARIFDLPVIAHAEDRVPARRRRHERGRASRRGSACAGIPAAAEEVMVARDVELARADRRAPARRAREHARARSR